MDVTEKYIRKIAPIFIQGIIVVLVLVVSIAILGFKYQILSLLSLVCAIGFIYFLIPYVTLFLEIGFNKGYIIKGLIVDISEPKNRHDDVILTLDNGKTVEINQSCGTIYHKGNEINILESQKGKRVLNLYDHF